MERTKISKNFSTAFFFVAVIALVFFAGCASSGSGVQTSLAKTSTPSSTGKIYSVTPKNGEKQQMTETEFRAYQNAQAQDAKEKQPQNPTTQKKGKKEEVTPSTTHKKMDKKGEKSGKKEVEIKTSTRTYTEDEFKSALLGARVEDKGQIADLTRQKNELANKVLELKVGNAQLSAQVQQLQEQRAPDLSKNGASLGRSTATEQTYPLTKFAAWVGYLVFGLCGLWLLYSVSLVFFKAAFSWLTWITLSPVISIWWFMRDWLTAVAVGGGFLFIALMLHCWKQWRQH